ncbi:MAG TPA: alpha/beta fold hydrolase [Myxococcota bacterium]|nr:alpha/beta fold hydrolase [Myxococcota bacterium]
MADLDRILSVAGAALSLIPFEPFRPRAPWWGPDLQTVRNAIRPRVVALGRYTTERLTFEMKDGSGDRLVGHFQDPGSGADARPLVVLIHGLSGSAESAYMETSAAEWLARGHRVLRVDLRGAGASRPLCRFQYHAGRTADLHDVLRALPVRVMGSGLYLVGYSLGGSLVLKLLAEYGSDVSVRGAAAVSAPIDLAAASQRFLAPRNRFYRASLLRAMKRESTLPGAELSSRERAAIFEARSVLEFDEHFVAPRNGYASAQEYYAKNSAVKFLRSIRVPTLVIHALDDPWIPAESYTRFPWWENDCLVPLFSPGGGHVGFHGRGSRVPWHDRCMALFFEGHPA